MSDNVNKSSPPAFLESDAVSLKVSGPASVATDPENETDSEVPEAGSFRGANEVSIHGALAIKELSPSVATLPQKFEPGSFPASAVFESKLPSSNGLKRHRTVIASCVTLSLALLGVSCLDLTHLISTKVLVDKNLQVTSVSKLPDLPFPMSYDRDANSAEEKLLPISNVTLGGKKFGFVDRNGQVVIAPQYTNVMNFSDGMAACSIGPNEKQKWGFIDTNGKLAIPAQFEYVGAFHNGVAPVQLNKDWQLINKKGKFIHTQKFPNMPRWFGNAYLVEETSLRVGLMDTGGKYLLPPIYSLIGRIAPRHTDFDRTTYYNYDENSLMEDGSPDSDYLKIGKYGHSGIADGGGQVIVQPQFDDIHSFNRGVVAVEKSRKIGFANTDGKFLMEPQFYSATPYDDLIAVRNGPSARYRLIDKAGKSFTEKTFEDIVTHKGVWLSEGLAAFGDNGKYGYLNNRGEVVIRPTFDFARAFKGGFAIVRSNNVWRIIDRNGNFASPIQFASIDEFTRKGADAVVAGPLYQYIESGEVTNANRALRVDRGLVVKDE